MNHVHSRRAFLGRTFLGGALAAPWVASSMRPSAWMKSAAAEEIPRRPTLDLHVHLFGLDKAATGCWMSEKITRGFAFLALSHLLNLRVAGKTLDQRYEEVLVEQLKNSGLSKAAILAQDAVYDRDGRIDWEQTSFYVPNDYVFTVVAKYPELMIPCPSINPNRADALEELNRCHEKGARMLKIHPPTQGVDVADTKHTKFFRRCQELDVLVLVHTGHEHSAPVIDKALAAPKRLALALEQGCRVVACHAGTGWISDEPDQLPEFLGLLKRYPKLWGDTAVLGTRGRVRDVERLLAEQELVCSRLLHGSDFPFPAEPTAFAARIGAAAAKQIAAEPNWLKRDFDLKEALGLGRASAERAYELVLGTPKLEGPAPAPAAAPATAPVPEIKP